VNHPALPLVGISSPPQRRRDCSPMTTASAVATVTLPTQGGRHEPRYGMMGRSGYGYRTMGRYSTTGSAVLLIRRQRARCHAWSLNGGPFKAAQMLALITWAPALL
jgi:hypothetical protein